MFPLGELEALAAGYDASMTRFFEIINGITQSREIGSYLILPQKANKVDNLGYSGRELLFNPLLTCYDI